ncbi:MAG: hypothetical protein M9887_08625 [Chitinophagales bacterium]|nr:hypothetical protein [Chitinophagales bacterium]
MPKRFLSLFILLGVVIMVCAQNVPLGHWQTHLPYANTTAVALSENYLYSTSSYAAFAYNLKDGSLKTYTKSEGLSDAGISTLAYDTMTNSLIIAYENSNIDILRNGKVTNLPYLMKTNISGGKEVFKIFAHNGSAWLATGFGVVEVRLDKQEIGDAYFFTDGVGSFAVNDIWVNDEYIYAATGKGVYRGERNPLVNLVNFQNWELFGGSQGLPLGSYSTITGRDNQVFTTSGKTIYKFEDDFWTPYYNLPKSQVYSLYKGKKQLICGQDEVMSFIPDNGTPQNVSGKYYISRPYQIVETDDGRLFYADRYRSTVEYFSEDRQGVIQPNGPSRSTCRGIDFMNGTVYVGSSSINSLFQPAFNEFGFYTAKDYFWNTYDKYNYPELAGKYDIAMVQAVPNESLVILGAHNVGLIEFNPETKNMHFIQNFPNATSNMRLTYSTKDKFGNVWMTNAYSTQPLICRKPGGEYIFFSSSMINNRLLTGIAIDDYQQIWMGTADAGVVVFDYGGTLDDLSDDNFININAQNSEWGLATNDISSIAVDKKGEIWIGTNQGAFNVPCPGSIFSLECTVQQICVPRNDGTDFCDPLLETETITSIAVDAANRKWFGTTNGLFLKSEDAYDNIYYFSEDNSPLLSNRITNLGIDPENGDVYILTEKGIISYRADAIEQKESKSKAYAYPNPVRPGYEGPIAIKNLPDNADVKVTDMAGRLVAEGVANGTQFVWDGKNFQGKKVSSGVYYILAVNKDKKEKASAKVAIVK